MISIAILLGSATPPGRLHAALLAAASRAGTGHDPPAIALIDLAALAIAPAGERRPGEYDDDTPELLRRIAAADAVLVATPVYRASLTGTLKNALDHLPTETLRDVPVGILSMGGGPDHRLGAERHLRDILSSFEALVAARSVYLTPADFDEGEPRSEAVATVVDLLGDMVELAGRGRAADGATGPR